jgi:hypothetical protein
VNQAVALAEHRRLTTELAENNAKALNPYEGGAMLVLNEWNLPETDDTLARAVLLSKNLGELLIGFIMFSKRIQIATAISRALLADPFVAMRSLYVTSVPLTDFARDQLQRIWSGSQVDHANAIDSGFAAFYASLITPFAADAWLMLAELKRFGACPDIDKRDHVREGIAGVQSFLKSNRTVAPEMRQLLKEGIEHLKALGSE